MEPSQFKIGDRTFKSRLIVGTGKYASFEETVKGKIEPEFYADFTVLNQELTEDNPMDILESQILFTIVGGKIVFQKNDR